MSNNSDVKFDIGEKAEQLLFGVFDMTTDKSHYPYKFRRLADRMQEYALNIHSDLLDANGIKSDSDIHKKERYELQTKAITTINKFLSLVKYSVSRNRISFDVGEEWTELVCSIKYMTLAWRKA